MDCAHLLGNFYRGDWRAHLPAGATVVSLRWNQAYSQPQAEPIQLGGAGASFSENSFALPCSNQREFPVARLPQRRNGPQRGTARAS